jgi:hypothetical protein
MSKACDRVGVGGSVVLAMVAMVFPTEKFVYI